MGNALSGLRVWNRLALSIGTASLLGLSLWAFWPLGGGVVLPVNDPNLSDEIVTEHLESEKNWRVFEVLLWKPFPVVAAPPQPPPPTPPAPPPPLPRLELLAVVLQHGHVPSHAIVYDPVTNQIHRAVEGSRVGEFHVRSIESELVRVESLGRVSELTLRRRGS